MIQGGTIASDKFMTKPRCILLAYLSVSFFSLTFFGLTLFSLTSGANGQSQADAGHAIVLHAARLLDVKNGRIVKPGSPARYWCRVIASSKSERR
jgi:hypothetical protein